MLTSDQWHTWITEHALDCYDLDDLIRATGRPLRATRANIKKGRVDELFVLEVAQNQAINVLDTVKELPLFTGITTNRPIDQRDFLALLDYPYLANVLSHRYEDTALVEPMRLKPAAEIHQRLWSDHALHTVVPQLSEESGLAKMTLYRQYKALPNSDLLAASCLVADINIRTLLVARGLLTLEEGLSPQSTENTIASVDLHSIVTECSKAAPLFYERFYQHLDPEEDAGL